MGWFDKKEAVPAVPSRVYHFEDFCEERPDELLPDQTVEARFRSLEKKFLDLKVRVQDLEASSLREQKLVDAWFEKLASETFCKVRDRALKELKAEVVITDALKDCIRQAANDVAKNIFHGNEASAFAKELGAAIIKSIGKRLGQHW